MKRTIESYTVSVQPLTLPDDFSDSLRQWIEQQGKAFDLKFLLAFADDGIIWGRFDGGQLKISHDVEPHISPPLRPETLWEVRLFSKEAELFLWNTDQQWHSRLVTDQVDGPDEAFDEDQILWGTKCQQMQDGFTLVREELQGVRHVVPITANFSNRRALRMTVRHYLNYDSDGVAKIHLSRLVDIHSREETKQ